MKIETLNGVCRIERKVVAQESGYGTDEITWVLLGRRFCHVQDVPASRSEFVKQGLTVALNQTRLRLNYCTDVDSTMRVIINRPEPQTFQIVGGPSIIGDKQQIELMLEKVSS